MLATKDGKLIKTSDGKLSQCCCGDCSPGNGLPQQGNSPPTSFNYPFTVAVSVTATGPTLTAECADETSPSNMVSLVWNSQVGTSVDFDPQFVDSWDTDVDGDYWGNGDIGSWCVLSAFGPTAQSDGYFSHPDCPLVRLGGGGAPCPDEEAPENCAPCQAQNNLPTYFEISDVRYGTVNGDTGWHVVTFGDITSSGLICGTDVGVDFDYLNTFLGSTPEGTVTRSLGGFTVQWIVSFS